MKRCSINREKYLGKNFSINKEKDTVTIINYVGYSEVYVKFEGYSSLVKTNMDSLTRRKSVKNPDKPSVCGVGVTGGLPTKQNGKHLEYYSVWNSMLKRCYSNSVKDRRPNYKGTVVCEDWKYLPNFKSWFDKNYIQGWVLDKDLKVFGSEIYSPETCSFVPNEINVLVNSNKAIRGCSGICGVFLDKRDGKYYPKISMGKEIWYGNGYYDSEKAFQVYATKKKDWVLKVIDNYPDIDDKVKSNLINCEITEDGVVY